MDPLTTAQIWTRFGAAAALSTSVCLAVGFVLLRTTGVPPTYPPFSPLPIASGAIGGALLVTLGYWALAALIRDRGTVNAAFVAAGVILLVASFYLPYRLSHTTSPRFAGVTVAAQVGQGLLHILVAGVSGYCFLRR
jgi:hypothetical protein